MPTVQQIREELIRLNVPASAFNKLNKPELLTLLNQIQYSRKKPKSQFSVLFDDYTVNNFRELIGIGPDQLITKTDTKTDRVKLAKISKSIREYELCKGLAEYARFAVEDANLDVMYDNQYKQITDSDIAKDYAYIMDPISDRVCAILVAHRGECVKYNDNKLTGDKLWNTWTVRIICNNKNVTNCTGGANKLLGLYCYALKTKKIQDYGLLEVADNYENIAAYCSYSKYGFVESNYPCKVFEWLQMATDLNKITTSQIVTTAITGKATMDNKTLRYCEELKRVSRLNELLGGGQDRIEVVNFEDFEPDFEPEPESSCSIM